MSAPETTEVADRLAARIKEPIERGIRFLKEAWIELEKVHWPGRQETLAATGVVIIVVLIVAIWLGLVDATLAWLVSGVLGS